MNASELASALAFYRFRYKDEKELQAGVAQCLTDLKVGFKAEHSLNPKDRVDFFVPEGGIGVECKTNDSKGGAGLSAVTRQLWRYAKSDEVKAIILITTRAKHRELPEKILDKQVLVVYLNSFL